MKRGILLALLIAIVVVGIYSVKEWMPIMAVAGDSMKPKLNRGDAILIGQVSPSEVEVGDVIVFKVRPLIQEHYRYPAMVAHRVTELTTFQGGLAFKTKGDNTAEDPFVVPASDLRGEVSGSVPYLGYLLLFLQSRQGVIFAVIALILLALDLYADELSQGKHRLHRGVFAPLIEQNWELAKSQQEASQITSDALKQFATAMAEYAQHLASHTDAVKSMASASHELVDAAHELRQQIRVPDRDTHDQEKLKPDIAEVVSGYYRQAQPISSITEVPPPGCYRRLKQLEPSTK